MTTSITAVFESGVLRPTAPLHMADGTRVELIIVGPKNQESHGQSAASILAEIAALPTNGGDPRTSIDHDRVLYGEQGAR